MRSRRPAPGTGVARPGSVRAVRPAVLLTAAVLVLAGPTGCTGAAEPGWTDVTPPGVHPSTVFAAAGTVLVGGQEATPDGRPALRRWDGSGWAVVPVTPATGYGQVATFVAGAVDRQGRVMLMGTATGGAHLNPRWTTWIGTVAGEGSEGGPTAGVVEEPQTAETFGGWDAGGVTAVTYGSDPSVVGVWSVGAGATAIAVWRHQGSTWVRQASPPEFAGAPPGITEGATAAAAVGAMTVLVGLQTELTGGTVHQRAQLWRSTGWPTAGPWIRLDLDPAPALATGSTTEPATGSTGQPGTGRATGSTVRSSTAGPTAGDPGSDRGAGPAAGGTGAGPTGAGSATPGPPDSVATDVTCTVQDCLVAGRRDGRLAVWRVAGDRVEPVPVPDQAVDPAAAPRIARDGTRTVVAVGTGPQTPAQLLLGTGDGDWAAVAGPPGDVRGLAVDAGAVLLLRRDAAGTQDLQRRPA